MTAIIKREVRNYLKRPLFWIGVAVVILGVFQNVRPYLETRYISSAEELENDLPETVHAGDVYEGYIPTEETERRALWEKQVEDTLRTGEGFELTDSEAVMAKIRVMDVDEACLYLENEYHWFGAEYFWEDSAYRKGTPEEINAYLDRRLEEHPFSWYFARKFADFAGLFMGFAATVLLAVLFLQDILSLVRGVTHTCEVGIACEAPMGFLSSVFCADTYVQEITSRRSEVWRLYPMKRKMMCVARRIGIQQCWLLLLRAARYGMFFLFQAPFPLYSPGMGGESELHLFLVYLAVIVVTLNFWGILGNTAACLTRSKWAGIGVCLVLWLTVYHHVDCDAEDNPKERVRI